MWLTKTDDKIIIDFCCRFFCKKKVRTSKKEIMPTETLVRKPRGAEVSRVGNAGPQINERVPIQDALRDQTPYSGPLEKISKNVARGKGITVFTFHPGVYSSDQRPDGFPGHVIFPVGSLELTVARNAQTRERSAVITTPSGPVDLEKGEIELTPGGVRFHVPTAAGERVLDLSTRDYNLETVIAKTGPFTIGRTTDNTVPYK